nr:hypothetical protein [Tanacetum cinerariifolium]
MMRDLIRLRSSFNVSNRFREVKDLWLQLLVGDLCQADLIGDEFHLGFELSFVKTRGNLLEDGIKNLKRSKRFKSEDVIEMKKNDDHIYREILGKAWYSRMKILRSVLFRKERMAGPKENKVKVAEKEETGKFHGSLNGGPVNLWRSHIY